MIAMPSISEEFCSAKSGEMHLLVATDIWCFSCVQVVKGADVVQTIEKVKTDRFDKPFEDVKMVNIEIKTSVD